MFDGYFDLETGEPRHPNSGYPRLRIGDERVWGFEVWWRVDPVGLGLTSADHDDLEVSKRLLRGLLRDVRRVGRPMAPSSVAPMTAR